MSQVQNVNSNPKIVNAIEHHVQNNCTSPVSSVSSRTSPLLNSDVPLPLQNLIQPILNGPILESKVDIDNFLLLKRQSA